MDNPETAKIAEAMIVEEPHQAEAEVSAQELMENLNETPSAEQGREEASQAAAAKEEPSQSPEDARKAEINAGLSALMEEGVTSEELLAFSQDATARKDVQAGKDVVRAFMAYTRRQASAVKEEPAAQKKSVPTLRTPGTAEPAKRGGIKEMSREEFAELSKKAEQAARMGKKVTFK